jgi:uncharacterized protein (TIGR02466 family)
VNYEVSIDQKVLFPTILWQARFPEEAKGDLDQQLLAKVLSTLSYPTQSKPSEGKSHTPRNLHEHPELFKLNNFVLMVAGMCLESMHVSHKGLAITGCWGNVSSPGASHNRHTHPNNYLSAVYYLNTGQGADKVAFHDPRPCTGLIRPPITERTSVNAETVSVRVEDGDLFLFPSWLAHSVPQNLGVGTRISIAYNIMFANYMSDMVKPMW